MHKSSVIWCDCVISCTLQNKIAKCSIFRLKNLCYFAIARFCVCFIDFLYGFAIHFAITKRYYKRSVWFIPDRQYSNPLPQLFTAIKPIYYDTIILIDNITNDDNAFKNAQQIFAYSLNQNNRYTLGSAFISVCLTFQVYKYIQDKITKRDLARKSS